MKNIDYLSIMTIPYTSLSKTKSD